MTLQDRKRLAFLLSKVVDGRAGDAEIEELELMMDGDQTARAYYLHYLALHSHLEELGSQLTVGEEQVDRVGGRSWPALAGLAACALVLIGVALWIGLDRDPAAPSTLVAAGSQFEGHDGEVSAVVGDASDVRWSLPGRATRGVKLGRGSITLESGLLSLDFPAGEVVSIRGPAAFEILDGSKLRLQRGECLLVSPSGEDGFAITTPNGTLVSLGARFAIAVGEQGAGSIRVLEGDVVASTINLKGVTSWEQRLQAGRDYAMVMNRAPERRDFTGRILEVVDPEIPRRGFDSKYAAAVRASDPLGYWRFNVSSGVRLIPDESGEVPLSLGATADVNEQGVLALNGGEADFAISAEAFPDINSERGFSLELWATNRSVAWQSLASLIPDQFDLDPSFPEVVHHPHLLLLERAGVSGSNWHHVHPDFAIRSLYRSPAGYVGGVNAYSVDGNLLHDWHHYVVVREQGRLRIYVDGRLSGSSPSRIKPDGLGYRLLLGRLHTFPKEGNARPWMGGIDEVSLYDRALPKEEVARHFEAAR